MIFRKLEELKPHPQNDYYFDDTEEAAFKLLKDDIESYGNIKNWVKSKYNVWNLIRD